MKPAHQQATELLNQVAFCYATVRVWTRHFGHAVRESQIPFNQLPDGEAFLRMRLMVEEHGETLKGFHTGDAEAVMDGIADFIWVVLGTKAAMGVDLRLLDRGEVDAVGFLTGSITGSRHHFDVPSGERRLRLAAKAICNFGMEWQQTVLMGEEHGGPAPAMRNFKNTALLAFTLADSVAEVLRADFTTVFCEVARANFAKFGPDGRPIYDASNKIAKPAGWQGPVHQDIDGRFKCIQPGPALDGKVSDAIRDEIYAEAKLLLGIPTGCPGKFVMTSDSDGFQTWFE